MSGVDINCDMGESFGAYSIGDDLALMDYVSSVNIACGFHAGDPAVMRRTVARAAEKNLAIGAHPGYPDIQGFGRREVKLSVDEVYEAVLYQVGALSAFARAAGTQLHHVKPHGALYNTAARDANVASAIARAVKDFDSSLCFVGLSGSELIKAGKKAGLKTISEVFADRTYQDDGSLTPRTSPTAMIEDERVALQQVLKMVKERKVRTTSGKEIPIEPDSICIHGDSKHALTFAKNIFSVLKENEISIRRP